MELLQAVARAMDLQVSIDLGPWEEVLGDLRAGRIAGVVGMHVSEERRTFADFSTPYAVNPYAVFTRAGEEDACAPDRLAGKEVLVYRATIVEGLAAERGALVVAVPTAAEALRMLATGHHDCALLFKYQGLALAQRLGLVNIRIGDALPEVRRYGFAVASGHPELLSALNEGLTIVKATGRYDELYRKWFGRLDSDGDGAARLVRTVGWALVPLALLLVMWAVWTRSLRGQVRARTRALEVELIVRRRAEAELAAQHEQLEVTLRSIGDAVITTDVDGVVVLMNPVAETLTGWPAGEAFGRPLSEVCVLLDERTRASRRVHDAGLLPRAGPAALAAPSLLVERGGRERLVGESVATIRSPGGQPLGVVLVLRDVTEWRRMEDELARSEKLESVGLLAGGIAHDFNNILAGVLGNVSLAISLLSVDHAAHRHLCLAEAATARASELTQQLLTFSQGGAPVKRMTPLDVTVRQSVDFALSGSRVGCRCELPADLWPAEVDPGQFSQVVSNLVLNAAQAMAGGGQIDVRADNVTGASPSGSRLPAGDWVRLRVRDHGPGIRHEVRDRIFEPFFTTKPQGTGLGLALSHSIVRRHDGWIGVESEPGQGTTFEVWLPASPAGRVEPAPPSRSVTGPRLAGRVLVMDDEEIVREVAMAMLRHLGCEVVATACGAELVATYRAALEAGRRFDAVICDLTVPGGMGGREALDELRAIDGEVRAIVSSGYSNDPIMADYASHGFVGVVAKPYRLEDLARALGSVLPTSIR